MLVLVSVSCVSNPNVSAFCASSVSILYTNPMTKIISCISFMMGVFLTILFSSTQVQHLSDILFVIAGILYTINLAISVKLGGRQEEG